MSVSALPADSCGIAIARLESDISDISDNRADGGRRTAIRDGLIALRDALAPSAYPVAQFEELFHDAPRLARAIRRIGGEREQLTYRVNALLGGDVPPAALVAGVQRLLAEVRGHRRRVADLLHEAYVVDIGGRE